MKKIALLIASGAIAAELGGITLAASGWHVYNHMEHVLTGRTITGRGCPYDCGLCPDHEQHSCLTLIEVTVLKRCGE